jgi:SET domain-containing protein
MGSLHSGRPYVSSCILDVRDSPIDGKGLFTRSRIPARRKIGELTGEVISWREARRRAKNRRRLALVERGDGTAVDGRKNGNEFRYINHSCSPNCYLRVCYGHVEFYSLRLIHAGEELTCDYEDNHHDGKVRCKCGSRDCRGYL